MPRQVASVVENTFVGGLNTEATVLKFPPNACTETFDCVFDETGLVSRRLGFDLENSYTLQSVTKETNEAFTEYVWQTVAGDGNRSFLVQQQGSTLRFYDVSESTQISDNVLSFTVDLDTYATGSGNPGEFPCQYTTGNGDLVVVNGAAEPIYVIFDPNDQDIIVTSITVRIRDFKGVTDGLDLNQRVTATVSGLATSNPAHYYNLINQGWGTADSGGTDALSQWDTARADVPSNADIVGLYRSSATDAFDNAVVTANGPGNTPAPKGHFILDAFDYDRDQALVDEGYTVDPIGSGTPVENIPDADGSIFQFNFGTRTSAAFDGTDSQAQSAAAQSSNIGGTQRRTIGKTLSRPYKIVAANIKGSNDQGFHAGGNATTVLEMWAKNGAAPSSATDGTQLATLTFTDTTNESGGRGLTSNNQSTAWDHVWINIWFSTGTNDTASIAEITFQTVGSAVSTGDIESVNTTKRPTTTAFYAGRVWYSGVDDQIVNSNIYFTQIIENKSQYSKCYQQNDPTSEEVSDLLPSDGGLIRIPEVGKIIKLFPYQASLIVLATNGVWRIAGGSGAFTANDYQVRKLSSIGTDSPLSVVDVKGLPVWWGDEGIYTIQYDANYDSFQVVSVTDNKIKQFIIDLPSLNRQYVKGAYDLFNDTIYWLYNSDTSLAEEDYYKYDRVLVFNGLSAAFYPWTIGTSDPTIRGIVYVVDGNRELDPVIKYTTTIDIDSTTEYLTWSDVSNTSYKDWTTYAGAEGDPEDEIDYTSYFITGYRPDASGMRQFMSNYIMVFFNPVENSSAYMQGIWDWTNTSDSGRWSTLQQVYNPNMIERNINYSRRIIRGHGRALQLRFQSESGKPFEIIGWGLREVANADL